MDEDRIALENALSYNSAMVLFQQRVNVLEGGLVKRAYMNFYSYFWTLALRNFEITRPFIKLEQQEGTESGLKSTPGSKGWTLSCRRQVSRSHAASSD